MKIKTNQFGEIPVADDVIPAFFQNYYPSCRKDKMEGTKTHPCYACFSTIPDENGEYVSYYLENATASLLNLRRHGLVGNRINLQLGKTYYVGIKIPSLVEMFFRVEKNELGLIEADICKMDKNTAKLVVLVGE